MILMTRDNPEGWKLDDLLREIVLDIEKKRGFIKGSEHPLKDKVLDSNADIISLLDTALQVHDKIYKELDAISPNEGPLKPRL